jgi:hypothetical protein
VSEPSFGVKTFVKFLTGNQVPIFFMKNAKVPIIFGAEVYFDSPCKLLRKGEQPTSHSELHMLQFEISN